MKVYILEMYLLYGTCVLMLASGAAHNVSNTLACPKAAAISMAVIPLSHIAFTSAPASSSSPAILALSLRRRRLMNEDQGILIKKPTCVQRSAAVTLQYHPGASVAVTSLFYEPEIVANLDVHVCIEPQNCLDG